MDPNGTRFHLIQGRDDWRACWQETPEGLGPVPWDDRSQSATLSPVLSLFRPRRSATPLAPETRRGSAADRFGNWYWIGHDARTIYWSSPGIKPRLFWTPTRAACPSPSGGFQPVSPPALPTIDLAGLAVTEHHYLVAGDRSQPGLLIFDLTAGGEPLLLQFPGDVAFEPFDLATAPGGGVWILDRVHHAYWGLDRTFRVVGEPEANREIGSEEAPAFRPVGQATLRKLVRHSTAGFPLPGPAGALTAIEGLPDGSVLILHDPEPGMPTASTLYRYRLGARLAGPKPLEDHELLVETGETTTPGLAVHAHDLAYVAADRTLYAVGREGKQVVAFDFDYTRPGIEISGRTDYLPLRAFGGRALVAAPLLDSDTHLYFDVTGPDPTRDSTTYWVSVHAVDQPRFQTEAVFWLGPPAPGSPPPSSALGGLFDGKDRGCVWHRLFLDACIPSETSVEIWTRANDDPSLVSSETFAQEPTPYLRGSGSEIPYYDPFAGQDVLPKGAGTWEVLLQAARGRFLQVKLVLAGNGRASPRLRAIRIYYPRFSYPRHYLPDVYLEDSDSAAFLERLLANPEGFYTALEWKMSAVGVLFDARSAPSDALDWLAGWWGLLLDPLWERIQQRRLGRTPAATSGYQAPAPDRRRLFIRFARKLFDRRGTPDGIRFALHLLLDSCLETNLATLKESAVRRNPALADELDRLGLSYPTPTTSEAELEDLLYDYTLSPGRPSKIRLVERFMTRDGRALAAGDPTPASGPNSVEANAHRFTVLVPDQLAAEEAAMVERIVRLEKPAHTFSEVRRYFDYFRVGEARLGLDTVLGDESRFLAMVIGRNYLAEGYLGAAPPMDAPDRVIADRDRLGAMPPL